MKLKAAMLFALIVIALLVFTIEMSYSQNFTISSNDLSAVNSSSSRLINPENLQIILRNDTSEYSDNGQQILLITGGMAAASAIVSGVIASILSYRYTKQLETMKGKYNNELEDILPQRGHVSISLLLLEYPIYPLVITFVL